MKKTAFIFILTLAGAMAWGQDNEAMSQQAAMQKLKWLVGEWEGKSEVNVDGQQQITFVKESITPMLNGTIFTISAQGTAPDSASKELTLVYNSFGVISYNAADKKYHWRTWRNPGDKYDETTFKVTDSTFEYITKESGGFMRYRAHLNSADQWVETGEYSHDKETWGLFITMKLNRLK